MRSRLAGEPEGDRFAGVFRRGVLLIGLAGVLLRAAYVLVASPELSGGADWRFFHATAVELAAGNGYRVTRPRIDPGAPVATALHPPLYPIALALWSQAAGGGERAHRLLGLVLGFATIAAVGALGRQIADAATGLVAAALAATSPLLIAIDGALLSETLFVALVALALLATYALRTRPVPPRAALLGLLVGLATLTRTEAALLVPLLVVPACVREHGRARLLGVALVVCAATVLVWTARNWSTLGRPVLVSTNACGVIGGANCAPTYRGADVGSWDISCLASPSGNEGDDAARWCRDGIGFALAHRAELPKVAAVRLLRTWNLWPGAFARVGEGQLRSVDRAGKLWLAGALVLATLGAVVLRRRGELLWPLVAPIAMASLAGMLGWGLPRLQAGALPALVVLSAVALAPLASLARVRQPEPA